MKINGTVGLGATLGIDDGSGGYTSISEIASISGPGYSAEAVDMTHLNPTDDYAEYLYGILDAGEVTFEGRHITSDTTHNNTTDGLLGIMEARALKEFQLSFPDGGTITFDAVVTGLQPNIGGHSEPVNMSVTLKVSAKPTYSPGP